MTRAAQPQLEEGRVYRTQDLYPFGANPTRLARRLVKEGKLLYASHGLYYAPIKSRFGQAPPAEEDILRTFLGGSPFVITGPPVWNSLGLGTSALYAATLVYNTKRTGEFTFDGRRYLLRRVRFPQDPTPEWFIVDLFQHHEMAGVSLEDLSEALISTLRQGRWDSDRLRQMASEFGTKATLARIDACIVRSGAAG